MMRALLLPFALLASAAVAQDVPPDLPGGAGPRGTSGEGRDDIVGYASVPMDAPQGRVAVLHPSLPAGSFVEVTALDSGRTIAALVDGSYTGPGVVGLTPDAARALGLGDGAGVRVRSVLPLPHEQGALRSGQSAGARLDAPPALLVALRRKLPPRGAAARRAADAPRTSAADPAPRPAAIARGRYGVQVATLSAADRAQALARQLSGHVVAGGGGYRIQLGPFPDAASAARARAAAARAGYADARIFSH